MTSFPTQNRCHDVIGLIMILSCLIFLASPILYGQEGPNPQKQWERLQQEIEDMEHREAANELREFTRQYAGWDGVRQARLRLGRALVLSGDVAAGKNILQRIINDAPRSAEAAACHYYIAKAQVAMGNFPAAIISYQVVRKRFPNHKLAPKAALNEAKLAEKIVVNDTRARQVYEEFVRNFPNHPRRSAVLNHLGVMAERGKRGDKNGTNAAFIQDWQIVGPFPNIEGQGVKKVFPPEKGVNLKKTYEGMDQKDIAWDSVPAKHAKKDGYIDLKYVEPNTNVCAYAYTTVASDAKRRGTLYLGSDDGIKVWVNGEEVLTRQTTRGAAPDQERVQIDLKKGENTLLLQISQGSGDWGFYCRLDLNYTWGPATAVSFYTRYAQQYPDDTGNRIMNGQRAGAANALWGAAELSQQELNEHASAVKLYTRYEELPNARRGHGYRQAARILNKHPKLGNAGDLYKKALNHLPDDQNLRLQYARWLGKHADNPQNARTQYTHVARHAEENRLIDAAFQEMGSEALRTYLNQYPTDQRAFSKYLSSYRNKEGRTKGRELLDRWLGRKDIGWKTAIARQWYQWTRQREDLERLREAANREGRMHASAQASIELADRLRNKKETRDARNALLQSLKNWGKYPGYPAGKVADRLSQFAESVPLMKTNPAWEAYKKRQKEKKEKTTENNKGQSKKKDKSNESIQKGKDEKKTEEIPPERIVSEEGQQTRQKTINIIRKYNLHRTSRGAAALANLVYQIDPSNASDVVAQAAYKLMKDEHLKRAAKQITRLNEISPPDSLKLARVLNTAADIGSKKWKEAWKSSVVPLAQTKLEEYGAPNKNEETSFAAVLVSSCISPKKTIANADAYLKQDKNSARAMRVRYERLRAMKAAGQQTDKRIIAIIANLEDQPEMVKAIPPDMVPGGPKGYDAYVKHVTNALESAEGNLREDLLLALGKVHAAWGKYREALDRMRELISKHSDSSQADEARKAVIQMMSRRFFAPHVLQEDAEWAFSLAMREVIEGNRADFDILHGNLWRLACHPAARKHRLEDFDSLYFYSAHGDPKRYRNAREFLDDIVSKWPGDGMGPEDEVDNRASPVAVRSDKAIGSGDKFTIYRWGLLRTPQQGRYRFRGKADDWVGLVIDGREYNFDRKRRGFDVRVELSRGFHIVQIAYADHGGGYHMQIDWWGPHSEKRRLSRKAFSAGKYPLILSRAASNRGAWGVEQWDQYLDKFPQDRRAQVIRHATQAFENPAKGMSFLEQQVKNYPGNPLYRRLLGDCVWRTGQKDKALKHYATAASLPHRNNWDSAYNFFYKRYILSDNTPVKGARQYNNRIRASGNWNKWQEEMTDGAPTARLQLLIDAAAHLQTVEKQVKVRQQSQGRVKSALAREKAQLQSARDLAKKKDAKKDVRASAEKAVARSERRIADLEKSARIAEHKMKQAKSRASSLRQQLGLKPDADTWKLYADYAQSRIEKDVLAPDAVFRVAGELWQKGERENVEPFLRYVLERSTDDGHIRWAVDRLVQLARQGENVDRAVELLSNMGMQNPRNRLHARWLQRACGMAREAGAVYAYARNAQVLAKLHPKNNKFNQYLDQLGKVFEKAGNYTSAEQQYKRVIRTVGDAVRVRQARLSLAGLYQKMGRAKDSLTILEELVPLTIPGENNQKRGGDERQKTKQEDARALLIATRSYLMLEKSHLAMDAYTRASAQKTFGKKIKPPIGLLMDLAKSRLDKREVMTGQDGEGAESGSLPPVIVERAESVLSLVDATFRFHADNMTVRQKVKTTLLRADANIMMRNIPQAIEEIRKAKKIAGSDPAKYLAELKMGEVHMASDNIQEALNVFEKVAELGREDVSPMALFWLGTTHLSRGQREDAVKAFRKLWELYAGSELVREAVYKIARTYAQQGDFLDAIRLYEAVGAIQSTPREKIVPGEMLTVKVWDADHYLGTGQYTLPVEVRASSGDTEQMRLEMNEINRSLFLGNIRVELGHPNAHDGSLQVLGTDVIYVTYVDKFRSTNGDGGNGDNDEKAKKSTPERNRLSVIQVVQNADINVSPTQFVEESEGEDTLYARESEEERREKKRLQRLSAKLERGEAVIRPGNPVYLRVEDADHDRSQKRDTVRVNAYTYAPGKTQTEREEEKRQKLKGKLKKPHGLHSSEHIPSNGQFSWSQVRAPRPGDNPRLDATKVVLKETEPHSGIFYGTVETNINGPTAIASDHAGDNIAGFAIDGKNNSEDAWLGFIDGKPDKWIEIDLKKMRKISRIMWDRGKGASDRYMIDYTITLRGGDQSVQIEREGNRSAHNNVINLDEPVQCRWIRFTAHTYDSDAPAISHIEVYDENDQRIIPPEISPLERVKNKVLEFNVGDCMAAEIEDAENMEPGRPVTRTSNPMGVSYVDGHIDAVYTSRGKNTVKGSVIHWIRTEQQRRQGHRGTPVYGRRTKRVPTDGVLQVAIADPDLDLNSKINTAKCEVFSTSGDTAVLEAEEIDNTAGIFTARIQLSPEESAQDSDMILQVRRNDYIKMRYRDQHNRNPGHAVYRNSFVFAADDELAWFPRHLMKVESPQENVDSLEPPNWTIELHAPDRAIPGVDRTEVRALSFATRDNVRFDTLLRNLDGRFSSKLPVEIMEKPDVGQGDNGPRRLRPLDVWRYHETKGGNTEQEEAFTTPLAVSGDDVVYLNYDDKDAKESADREFLPIVSSRFLTALQNEGVDVSALPEEAIKQGVDVDLKDPISAMKEIRAQRIQGVKHEIALKKLNYKNLLEHYDVTLERIAQKINKLSGNAGQKAVPQDADEASKSDGQTEAPQRVRENDAPLAPDGPETGEEGSADFGAVEMSENLIKAAALRRQRDKLNKARRALEQRLEALGRYATEDIEEQILQKREEARSKSKTAEKGQSPEKRKEEKEQPAWYEKDDWWKETGGLVPGTTLNVRIEDSNLQSDVATVVASVMGDGEPMIREFRAEGVDGKKNVFTVEIPTGIGEGVEEKALQLGGARNIMLSYRDSAQKDFPTKRAGYLSLASNGELAVTSSDFLEMKEKHYLGEDIYLLVQDADMDKTSSRDYLWTKVESGTGDVEHVALCETQAHSGVFRGTLPTIFGKSKKVDGQLNAQFGGSFKAVYVDGLWLGDQVVPPKRTAEGFFVEGSDGSVEAFARQLRRGSLQRDVLFNTALAKYELGKSSMDLGAVQRGQRYLSESADRFQALVVQYPDNSVAAHATYYLGNIKFLLGDYPAAVESLQTVINRWPNSEFKSKALYKLGTCHLKAGKREKAIESFVNLAYHHEKSPLVADAMLTLAEYYSDKDFYNQAIGVGRAFTRKFPKHEQTGSMYLRLAGWLITEEKLKKAVTVLKEAEEKLPNSSHMPAYLYWHADALFKLYGSRSDEYQKGVILLKRIKYDYPDSRWARYAKARLAEVDTD